MAISTKNVKTNAAGPSKTIEPGSQQCKINGVELVAVPWKEGAYHLAFHVESPEIGGDFQGFPIDKDDPTKGNYKGAVGKIKAGEWPFSDGTTKGGVAISRDTEILKFIKNICVATGNLDWLDSQNEKHDTIESLVAKFDKDKPFKDVFIHACVAGKEYKDKKGYTRFDLYFPKYSRSGSPFVSLSLGEGKLIKFDPIEHIKKEKIKDVDSFGESKDDLGDKAKEDFTL